jgi:hypothetical protein
VLRPAHSIHERVKRLWSCRSRARFLLVPDQNETYEPGVSATSASGGEALPVQTANMRQIPLHSVFDELPFLARA